MKTNEHAATVGTRGKARYIFHYGVLIWGVITATLFVGWTFFTKKQLGAADIVIPFIMFPLGGILFGAFMWSVTKHRSEDAQSDNSK